jgi:hypothetical protein
MAGQLISYAFEGSRVPLVQSGLVTQTFEAPRPRHARVGERIRLVDWSNLLPIIPDTDCVYAARCEVVWTAGHISSIREGGIPLVHVDRFAEACGYEGFADFETMFAQTFGPSFMEGYVIGWRRPTAAQMAEVA